MAALYIVATPIGNLKDITLRALDTLAEVDIIACEDTRIAQKLLSAHGVSTQLISYHQHNTDKRDAELISKLQQGYDVALISDAGTPLISDPGHSIVSLCRQHDIQVVPIPGACAAITALSANDLSISRYIFEGFLPPKRAARIQRLQNLCNHNQAIIFYEAKHRIQALLEDISEVCGASRRIILARELTKMHEQIASGTIEQIIEMFIQEQIPTKGEFVIVLEGAKANASEYEQEAKMRCLFEQVAKSMTHKDALKLALQLSDLPKNKLYEIAREYY